MKLIDKSAVVAEIENRIKELQNLQEENKAKLDSIQKTAILLCIDECKVILSLLDTLEVKDPYEQCIQYPSIEDGIKAHAEIYSFNIESELFNQLTKEQQALWRKEIEQACISGGNAGVELARDIRYKENVEMKEVDLEKELNDFIEEQKAWVKDDRVVEYNNGDSFNHIYDLEPIAKHFFELGLKAQKRE